MTPPPSQSGTPVRGLSHREKPSPSPSRLAMPDNSAFEDQVLGGSSSFSPEQEMEELVGTDGSEDEQMDQDGVEVGDENVKEGAEATGVNNALTPGANSSGLKSGKVSWIDSTVDITSL